MASPRPWRQGKRLRVTYAGIKDTLFMVLLLLLVAVMAADFYRIMTNPPPAPACTLIVAGAHPSTGPCPVRSAGHG